jgi:hypothetical protein
MEKSVAQPIIDNLKKVTLQFTAGTSEEKMDIIEHPRLFTFICGLGPAGLTPFEYALAGKAKGDKVCLHIESEEINRIFLHIHLPLLHEIRNHKEFFMMADITIIEDATSREVVKAMAAMAECESHCDCGCGCG